ncbi:MAG: class I SAM-dependent methyltransferase [Ignavibacteria bacterium]
MVEFDYQWKELLRYDSLLSHPSMYECNEKRVIEFLKLTNIKPWYKKNSVVKGKVCLDAGCGPGRWTCAMLRLGATKVDSFDISEEAVNICKQVNPNAYVFDLWNLKINPIYDFVLSWGVLHHTQDARKAFSKVASQVKNGGMLHVMVYDKKNDRYYEGFRGESCVEKHKLWESLSAEEKIKFCEKMVKTKGGSIHGWFDALNPMYNWSFSEEEVIGWFRDEGFSNIRRINMTHNINMNGIKK